MPDEVKQEAQSTDAVSTVLPEQDLEKQKFQADMDLVAHVANNLVEKSQDFGQLIASMLASRQLYAMCLYEMEWLMRDDDFTKVVPAFAESSESIILNDNQKVMLKEILINAAAVQAQQPFDEKVLFAGMTKTVFPWMKKAVDKHTTWQNDERKKQFEERENVRVQTKIDTGLPLYLDAEVLKVSEPSRLERTKSLLFVGESTVLSWLADRVTANIVADGSGAEVIVRLCKAAPKYNDPRLIHVPFDAWKGCADTNTSFQKVYANFVLPQLNNPVDVVVVDNLLQTSQGMAFAAYTTVANESQHKLKKWTEAAGALLISFLPVERQLKANELNTPEYEMLRIHNVLRGVVAEPIAADEKSYRILVGQQEVAVIPAEELEAYKAKTIVLP